MTIQSSLRQLRLESGFTMTELARKAGVSRTYISELESGKATVPSLAVVTALAKALGVSPAVLINEPEMNIKVSIPQSLARAAEEYGIPEEDIRDLAAIRFRSFQPVRPDDWKFLYDALRRSMPREVETD